MAQLLYRDQRAHWRPVGDSYSMLMSLAPGTTRHAVAMAGKVLTITQRCHSLGRFLSNRLR